MTTSKESSNGWARNAVTFRLSPRRRQELRALCGDEADSLSPTAALDRAIALAGETLARGMEPVNPAGVQSGNSGKSLDRQNFDELLAQIREEGQQLRDFLEGQTIRSGEILAAIGRQFGELKDLINSAANGDYADTDSAGGCDEDEQPRPQLPRETHEPKTSIAMRDWLNHEAVGLPHPAFVLKTQWQETRRLSDHSIEIRLIVQRVATANISGPRSQGEPGFVCLTVEGPHVDASAPLTSTRPAYLRCQLDTLTAWRLSIHASKGQGEPARSIFSMSL